MANIQPLDDLDIVVAVLQFDADMYQTALIGHLAKSLVDDGSVTFPAQSYDALDPLFTVARNTQFPSGGTLRPPASGELPDTLFPIHDLQDLLQKTLALIRFQHGLPDRPPKA